ncbi:MAG: hypothetical protein ABIH26_12295 [Candidatus Eisenbacteria bacterium]
MKPIGEMTDAELAAFVQSHLRKKGIDVVLSGGACVSIYSGGRYVSMDLDMVGALLAKPREIRTAMREIGFQAAGRHFRHPGTEFLVEFLRSPLSVGEEPVRAVEERRLSTGILRMISPTDCVKDRLAAYYHWNDRQCLEQASMVARANDVDLDEIERWSRVEGKLREFRRIKDRLTASG